MWQFITSARAVLDAVKRAIEILSDVGHVFDADGDAQEPIGDAEAFSLFRRQPAMRRDRWIKHLGEKIADRRRGGGELERIKEPERRLFGVLVQNERDDASIEAAELAGRERVRSLSLAETAHRLVAAYRLASGRP